MLASADADIVAAARDFREFDRRPDRKQRFNIQMTDLQAAIGREQLKKLPLFAARRALRYSTYTARPGSISWTGQSAARRFAIARSCVRVILARSSTRSPGRG